ncbi:MAG: adaptor protein MecA [Clostridia bacterium]|nr:adaptor protein MecA [Clostridia bacterium]
MELISINENKLKIIMSEADMQEYGLDENEFYLSISNARVILNRILKKSDKHTGFENINPEDKILIQLYPEIHGGCELYVTKITLCDESSYEEEIFMPPNDEKYLLPKSIKSQSEQKRASITYSFLNIDDVILTCKELKRQNFSGSSSLYRYNDKKYFLVLDNSENATIRCLSEFGELENTENTILKALERGKCIFKQNAVALLSEI